MVKSGAMVKMQISKNARQTGLTLFELLVVLSLIGLVTSMSMVWLVSRMPQMAVTQASDILLTDLQRAKLLARTKGTTITVTLTSKGYSISDLAIKKNWPKGVSTSKQSASVIVLPPYNTGSTYKIFLHKGSANATITVDMFSGRIIKTQ